MSKEITVQSVLNPDKKCYRLAGDWPYDKKGSAPLSLHITEFETYGDGQTQHTPAWCSQWADLTDVCLSFARAIVADPANEVWRQFTYVFHENSREGLEFALSIKYREDKRQWFNLGDRKISSAPAKQYDKRWTEVQSWMDGKPENALSILFNAQPFIDWLSKLALADDLRDASNYYDWETLFKPVTELKGDWLQSFRALRSAVRAIIALDYANRASESALSNSQPKPETQAAA